MTRKIFVDGQVGTTGLKIHERLAQRSDLEILEIDPSKRKDPEARRNLLNEADVAFLCLPDDAARESASLVTSSKTTLIDASTAHRVHPDWTYGLPELRRVQRGLIAKSKRITVPGCHATGFVMTITPLIDEGVLSPDYPVTSYAVAGYSGGGKQLIEKYQAQELGEQFRVPHFYSLDLSHKHLPEMQQIPGLSYPPMFNPIVANLYNGEIVAVPLLVHSLSKKVNAADVHELYSRYYQGERFVKVMPLGCEEELEDGFFCCIQRQRDQ